MADVEFSHRMGGYDRDAEGQGARAVPVTQSLVTATNIAGAVTSIALIAGVGVWGYKLMMRDVTGIPIVRAAQGEMRVLPEDPGGQLAQHQGLAVNAIAASGAAAGPVDQVTLAPPAVALDDEDQPVITPAAATEDAEITPADILTSAAEAPPVDLSQLNDQAQIDAAVAQLMGETGPQADIVASDADSGSSTPSIAASDTEPAAEEAAPILAGLQQSVRPRLRPASAIARLQPVSYTPPAASAEIDPAAIPSGTRLAQLGAFDSPDVARSEWVRLQGRFGSMLDDKSRVIEEAQSGGRTFYRLRAMGFVDLSDTRRFCSAIKAEGVDCIPVQVK